MHKVRFIANIVIVAILLSIIFIDADLGEEDDENDSGESGYTIIWPSADPLHEEWNGEILLAPGGGSNIPFTYRDYDFQVNDYATSGLIVVSGYKKGLEEDVDIELYGAELDDNGNRRQIATSASNTPEEVIELVGTPDPYDLDDFFMGGNGTWTLRVKNYASVYGAVEYDIVLDIYYDGAEAYISEED